MARSKSILTEARQIERAVTLINLGARLQVLESETDLSYERLLRLYKEVAGKSPSKGQLPFSTDWFMTWQPNIHASLFLNIHEYLNKAAALDEIDSIIKAYKLYTEQMSSQNLEPLLSVTRAWRLVKFVDNGMLTMTACSKCKGHFITHPHEIARHYVCGLCNPPARAGKGKLQGSLITHSPAKGKALADAADAEADEAPELYADVVGDDELHTILRAEAKHPADTVPAALLAGKLASKGPGKTRAAVTN
jgi:flagellar transcriptional activator FlhC